jgi:hypothetical protein
MCKVKLTRETERERERERDLEFILVIIIFFQTTWRVQSEKRENFIY